jgi:hypothetical protein
LSLNPTTTKKYYIKARFNLTVSFCDLWFTHLPHFRKGSEPVQRCYHETLQCLMIIWECAQLNKYIFNDDLLGAGQKARDLKCSSSTLGVDRICWENRTYGWDINNIKENVSTKLTCDWFINLSWVVLSTNTVSKIQCVTGSIFSLMISLLRNSGPQK